MDLEVWLKDDKSERTKYVSHFKELNIPSYYIGL